MKYMVTFLVLLAVGLCVAIRLAPRPQRQAVREPSEPGTAELLESFEQPDPTSPQPRTFSVAVNGAAYRDESQGEWKLVYTNSPEAYSSDWKAVAGRLAVEGGKLTLSGSPAFIVSHTGFPVNVRIEATIGFPRPVRYRTFNVLFASSGRRPPADGYWCEFGQYWGGSRLWRDRVAVTGMRDFLLTHDGDYTVRIERRFREVTIQLDGGSAVQVTDVHPLGGAGFDRIGFGAQYGGGLTLDGLRIFGYEAPDPTTTERQSQGQRSVMAPVAFPGTADVQVRVPEGVAKYNQLSFDCFVEGATGSVQAAIALVTDENLWYQHDVGAALPTGRWIRVSARLDDKPDTWRSVGHRGVWDPYSPHQIRKAVLRCFSREPWSGRIFADNFVGVPKPATTAAVPLTFVDFEVLSPRAVRYGKFELAFGLSRAYDNPFDPDAIDVTAHFTGPDGTKSSVPAFFYQDYERKQVDGKEVVAAGGGKQWRVRFCPKRAGRYTCRLTARDATASADTPEFAFTAEPSADRGFVRVRTNNCAGFEFESGPPYYPIGASFCYPWDVPYGRGYVGHLPVGEETYAFDHYFRRMAANGMDWTRVWTVPWWLGLEWTAGKGPFPGLGRYSLENAWKMDHVLEQAERDGLYVWFTLYHSYLINDIWGDNPYNALQGGPCRDRSDILSDAEARRLFKQRYRYVIARWGYSTHVFCWDIWSEMDIGGLYGSGRPAVRQWYEEMTDYLQALDPNHMLTSHFSQPGCGQDIYPLRALAFTTSNAYSMDGNQPQAIRNLVSLYARHAKPVVAGEYGGHWAGIDRESLRLDLHAGLWTGVMTPLGGTPLFWWWNLLDNEDLYFEYRNVAAFLKGEDINAPGFEPATTDDAAASGFALQVLSRGTARRRWLWIYDPIKARRILYEDRIVKGGTVRIRGLDDGAYAVEIWDTKQGRVTRREAATAAGGVLAVSLPDFQSDLAVKVRSTP